MLGSRASDRGEALAGSLDEGLVLSASTARRVETRARPILRAGRREGHAKELVSALNGTQKIGTVMWRWLGEQGKQC